jgi:glycosyltransferase involved in cell wall biosynthesis
MSAKSPKITVLLPVYNSELYIKDAVDSILNQTFSDFEFIIIDDASTDKSVEIIQSYSDSRIQLIVKPKNSGYTDSLNYGLTIAKGEYIARMDSDDISLPTRFEKQIEFLQKNSEVVVCGTWITVFGNNIDSYTFEAPQNSNEIKLTFLSYDCIAHPSVMFRKSCVMNLEYKKEFVPAEDYKLWSEIIVKHDFSIIQEALLLYRQHENNISKAKADNLAKSDIKIKTDLFQKIFGLHNDDFDFNKLVHLFNILGYRKKLSKIQLLEFFEMAQKIIKINKEKVVFPEVLFKNKMEELLTKPFIYSKTNPFFVFELKRKFPNEFKLLSRKSVFNKIIKF